MHKFIGSVLLAVAIAVVWTFAGIAAEQTWCPLCGMNLKMFWKTTHWLTFPGGERTGYCSIHCASIAAEGKADKIKKWEVVDYDTKKPTDAWKAFFLVGSDLPGTMTANSKLGFASKDTAESYLSEHGGKIVDFDVALNTALADRGADMSMLKKKVSKMAAKGEKLAEKHGCFKCHGEGGAGGKGLAWSSPEFAKKMDDKVKIKQAIVGGSHEMKAYGKSIPEKQLQAVMLYVWSKRSKGSAQ